jgi:hypothetical protein
MKITIDTQHDTHEDIKKVLHILSNILEKKDSVDPSSTYQENISTTNNETSSAGFMSMFGDSSTEEQKEVPDTPPDFSSFLDIANKKEDDQKEEKPRLQFF